MEISDWMKKPSSGNGLAERGAVHADHTPARGGKVMDGGTTNAAGSAGDQDGARCGEFERSAVAFFDMVSFPSVM